MSSDKRVSSNGIADLCIGAIKACSTKRDQIEIADWLKGVRTVVDDEALSTAEKIRRTYALADSKRTGRLFLSSVGTVLKTYQNADLPLSLKIAAPITLGAAAFIGGQGAGIAALGGAVGAPVLLVVFLGSAGITAIIEGLLGRSDARNYIGTVLALIARDALLMQVSHELRKAMAARPAAPHRFAMPAEEQALRKSLLAMDPYDFECHVMSFFQRAGLLAWTTQQSNDQGVDGFARHPEGLIVVQCKRYNSSNPVGFGYVSQLLGVLSLEGAWRSYLVTTSRFTKVAIQTAAQAPVKDKIVLVDMDKLVEWHTKGSVVDPALETLQPYDEWIAGEAQYRPMPEPALSEVLRKRLEELEMLRDKGFLSDADFQKESLALRATGTTSDRHTMTEPTRAGDLPEAIKQAGKENYLGNPIVVDTLLRELIGEVIERMKRVKTEEDREKAIEADKAACYRYADIFTGQDARYVPMAYHTGAGIHSHLRRMGINAESPREAVAGLLAQLVLSVYEAVNSSAAGKSDDTWQYAIDDMIEHCTKALSGMGSGFYDSSIENK